MTSRSEQERTARRIEFVAAHQPTFPVGTYTFAVEQHVSIGGADTATFRSRPQTVVVQSPRFALDPRQIQGVFPPEGSLGDHATTLPHVLLTPSTLPWERSGAAPADPTIPWLALLVFDADELPQLQSTTAGTLQQAGLLTLEEGQHADDPVSVIQVPAVLLAKLLPRRGELRWLTHVRRSLDGAGRQQNADTAVVVSNRLPRVGGVSVAHLVSVEGRYTAEAFPSSAQGTELVSLVSLMSWRFSCVDTSQGVRALLQHIPQETLRRPDSANTDANHYLSCGYVPLPHAMRAGNRSVSWYRGPLAPGHVAASVPPALPARSSDALMRYNPALSMFDVSYAAAWELGRLMMLNAKGVALDLYHWKRRHAQHSHEMTRKADHLPFASPAPDVTLPASVGAWVEQAALLKGIPFQYLIPDEQLLPRPSIRFFQVDQAWLACLLDGALSIGSISAGDHRRALGGEQRLPPLRQLSGLLLRSEVVSAWEHLQVDGYARGYREGAASDETRLLFTMTDAALAQQFGAADIDVLRVAFQANGVTLSGGATLDQRGWEIRDAVRYEIVEVDNGRLDVRQSGQSQRHHIAGGAQIKAALSSSVVSEQLRQALRQQKIEVAAGAPIVATRWLIADGEQQSYYLIEFQDAALSVYRDYRLPLLRMEPLSRHVLLCLFEGLVQTVDIYQRPESIHHGVDTDGAGYFKRVRNNNGVLKEGARVPVALRADGARVIDIVQLASTLADQSDTPDAQVFTAAQFALQMIEDVPKVRYLLSDEIAFNPPR